MPGIGIVGFGAVGQAMVQVFPEAVIYDKYLDEYTGNKNLVNACQLAIICVPTPETEDGATDTSIVEEAIGWLETPLILIKSTVPPGTTDHLRGKYSKHVTFSPEYVSGESSYYQPPEFGPLAWPYVIVGGEPEDTRAVINFFIPRLGPTKVYRQTNAHTAELTKYMSNAWLALQVTFANEFYEIANGFGIDYVELRELWGLDPRVSRISTSVFPGARGFGGKCLPKDMKGLIKASQRQGYDPELLDETLRSNVRFRAETT